RRPRPLDPRIRPGRPHGGQVESSDLAPAHPAQSDEPAGRTGGDPVRRRHCRRGGPVLRRPRRPAARAQLGPDAGRGPDHDRLRALAGHHAGAGHLRDRAGPQPDRRRPARPVRPARAAGALSMTVLDIRDLSLSIGSTSILKSVSLSVAPGEILGLVGESGSGKSMTSLAVLGLAPPRATLTGEIRLNGQIVSNAPDAALQKVRGRDVGIIFQEPMTALNPVMTIGDQVAETVRLHKKTSRKEALTVARSVLDRVGLPAEQFPLGRFPHELSGGQRQRVAIAIAIALTPKLLIADEATTALDVTTQAQVLDLLKRLVREDGMGLILITHDLAVVAETADRLAVMKDGELVEEAPVDRIRTGMAHDYSRRLLANATHAPTRLSRPQADAAPVLEVEGLVREYGGAPALFGKAKAFRAVDQVSLSLQPGESVGRVGESGCGKPTLLRAILALEAPQAGRVRVKGRDITAARGAALKAIRRDIQVVFQDPYGSFDPRWKVSDLVAENFHLLDARPTPLEARRRVDEMLERVGLTSAAADRYPHEF